MSDWTIKHTTVPVPVTTSKGWQRGASWTAEVTVPSCTSQWRAEGKTEADAKRGLAELLAAGLIRIEDRPVLVIGGAAPDYDTSIHVVMPSVHGYTVHIVRDGRCAGTWGMGNDTSADVLDHVLAHVGGDPKVVRL